MEIDLESILEHSLWRSEVRKELSRQSPRCPSCDTAQVYILSLEDESVSWKCRRCKETWEDNHLCGKLY